MKPQQQNRAIAEYLFPEFPVIEEGIRLRHQYPGGTTGPVYYYCADLESMRDAEKRLGDKAIDYDKHLREICSRGSRVCDFSSTAGDYTWHADAEQRAEAFLRTINKWVDE